MKKHIQKRDNFCKPLIQNKHYISSIIIKLRSVCMSVCLYICIRKNFKSSDWPTGFMQVILTNQIQAVNATSNKGALYHPRICPVSRGFV